MDVSKLPPPGLPANPTAAGTIKDPVKEPLVNQPVAAELAAIEQQDLETLARMEPLGDRADIRPLDVPGGLQILLAEIRASFDFPAGLTSEPGESNPQSATQAARQIVQWVLQAMPEDATDVPAWSAALTRMEASLQSGLQQGDDTVAAWRDVPAVVVDAVKQSGSLVLLLLSDERPNPLWLRPEWVGLAPRLERFRRRRRAARRRLTDPDHWQGSLDDNDEHRT